MHSFGTFLSFKAQQMISMSTKQKIILYYFREGKSQRQIAQELHIARKTVKKYIESYQASAEGVKRKKPVQGDTEIPVSSDIVSAPKYDSSNRGKRRLTEEITSKIDSFLESNSRKRASGLHKQVMKKIDIHEALLAEGFQIGYTSVCTYITGKERSSVKEAYIRQRYDPGDVCEFDWGEVKLWISGSLQRFYLAVFTSAYSNYRYAELYERQDTISFQQSHVNFFTHQGGVHRQMVYDNMRVAVKRFVGLTEKEPTEAMLQLATYYQFGYRFCNAGKGNEKGHVERSVEYIRRKAFGRRDDFDSLHQANQWLKTRCKELNEAHPHRKSAMKEKEYLYALPAAPFDCCSLEQCRVDKYATVMIGSNRYSVPDHLVGKMVSVKVYAHNIRCYHERTLVAEHHRSTDKHDWVITLEHYLDTLHKKPGALHSSVALERSRESIRNIYQEHFREAPRDFIELLGYMHQNEIKTDLVETAIDELQKMGCREVTTDKIITLCSQNKTVITALPDNEIARHSKVQLDRLTKMFNQTSTLTAN